MGWIEKTKEAFAKAVEREYNLNRYAEKIGVSYSIVNRLRSGKTQFEKLDLSTFFRLFPEMRIFFFREEYPERSSVKMNTIEAASIRTGIPAWIPFSLPEICAGTTALPRRRS